MFVVQPTEKASYWYVSRYVHKLKDVFKKISRKMAQDKSLLFHTPEHVYPSYEEVFHPTSGESSDDSGVMLNSKVFEPRSTPRRSRTFLERRKKRYFNSTRGSFVEDGERYRDQSTKVTELYSGEGLGFESEEVIDTELQVAEVSEVGKKEEEVAGFRGKDEEVVRQCNNDGVVENHNKSDEIPDHTPKVLTVEVEVHVPANTPVKSLEEKFVVNLYESRRSHRWKERKGGIVPKIDAIELFDNKDNDNDDSDKYSLQCLVKEFEEDVNHNAQVGDLTVEYSKPWRELDSDALFFKLKKLRDMECVKMCEVSKAVKMLKAKPDRRWSDELFAEKLLLETGLKYRLIVLQLRQLLTEPSRKTPRHTASVTLSNFCFDLKPNKQQCKGEYKDFYVLVLSHGTELLATTSVTPQENSISFTERFHLKNIGEDFEAKVEVFSIRIPVKRRMWNLASLIRKKSRGLCPMLTIYYENVNTYELRESTILKSSFLSCGSATITSADLGNSSFTLTDFPPDSPLATEFTAATHVDAVNLDVNFSGFLNLGRPDTENNVLFWDRKWCSLGGTNFRVYNYPQDEELGMNPEVMIDLEYCLAPLVKEPGNCPRKRSFVLKTGRPGTFGDDNNNVTLRKKNNFVLEKYYLVADNGHEFEKWTSAITSVLECLKCWKKLVFADDYYLKS